jgi:hypothetical protein
MYSNCNEDAFVPGRCGGLYSPSDLLGITSPVFHGIEEEFAQMKDAGFSILDTINSQAALLDIWNRAVTTASGARVHSLNLVAPFLMCGKFEDAFFEIDHQYTHRMIGFFKTYDCLLHNGKTSEYWDQLHLLKEDLREATDLWLAMIGHKDDYVRNYLNQNFERNVLWAQKYSIAFSNDFHKVDMPQI